MVLKSVHHFVAYNVPRHLVGFHYRHYNTVFQTFGNAPGSYINLAINSGGLLEIGVVGVKDNGVGLFKGIPEHLLVQGVPGFAFLCKTLYHAIVLQVIIYLEMRRAVNLELKVFVTHLILPEILGPGALA